MASWRDIPVTRKLYAVIGTMALLIACELATLRFAMQTLSAVRTFVQGEALWSKAQKDSAIALQRYALTRDDSAYREFLADLRIPDGDHRARLALEQPTYDLGFVRRGFMQGGLHPADIDGIVYLLRRFHRVSYLARAIGYWRQADALLAEFRVAGMRYHDLTQRTASDPTETRDALERIQQLNARLTVVEASFSEVLGEGSRWMERVVITLLVIAVLTVESIGLTLTFQVSRAISRGLAEANATAARMGAGHFAARMPVRSENELGQLARSLNQMGDLLARSYGDLEERVRTRTADLEAMGAENARLLAEARNAVQMRDEFISIVSHEIRTPLATLALQVSLLLRQVETLTVPQPDREALRRRLLAAGRQGERLSALTSSLIDLTNIRLGRLEIHRRRCDLAAVIRDAVSALSGEGSRVGSAIETVSEGAASGDFDPVRIGQVATNLISNAIKYGNGNPVRVTIGPTPRGVRFAVRDHGIGIAAVDQVRVFDRFERTAEAGARSSGLGLGLYISRQIVEAHAGTIEVDSRLGEGTCFTVDLPEAPAAEAPG